MRCIQNLVNNLKQKNCKVIFFNFFNFNKITLMLFDVSNELVGLEVDAISSVMSLF